MEKAILKKDLPDLKAGAIFIKKGKFWHGGEGDRVHRYIYSEKEINDPEWFEITEKIIMDECLKKYFESSHEIRVRDKDLLFFETLVKLRACAYTLNEGDDWIDWADRTQKRYFIMLTFDMQLYIGEIGLPFERMPASQVYFKSEELQRSAIDLIGLEVINFKPKQPC